MIRQQYRQEPSNVTGTKYIGNTVQYDKTARTIISQYA